MKTETTSRRLMPFGWMADIEDDGSLAVRFALNFISKYLRRFFFA